MRPVARTSPKGRGGRVFLAATLLGLVGVGVSMAVYQAGLYAMARRGTYGAVRPAASTNSVFLTLSATEGPRTGREQNAVILLYNTTCTVCNQNMANWMTLIAELRETSPQTLVAAVSVESPSIQQEYWKSLLPTAVRLHTLIKVDDFVVQAGTRRVPSTIVVRNGQIAEVHEGVLGPARQTRVLALLQ
jgi:hypothetical protein